MKIFFVRHGESKANIGAVSASFLEDKNNSLTSRGRLQVQKTAEQIPDIISEICSSPMYRTIESAKEFLKTRPEKLQLSIDERLREIDYDVFTDDRDNPKMAEIAQR